MCLRRNTPAGADELLPSATAITAIYSNGQLPQNALFNSTAPSPAYAAMTPATTPANLAPSFALGFGTNDLVTNAYRLAYLQDAAANPDGGYPTTTTGVAAAAPGLALRQDLKSNDLRNWAPTAPVLLCAGDSDPTVFYLNTQLIDGLLGFDGPDELGDPTGCGFIARERRSLCERKDWLCSREGGRRGGCGDRWRYGRWRDGRIAGLSLDADTAVLPVRGEVIL